MVGQGADTALARSLLEALEGRGLWAAAGCGHCLEGYKGRIGLFELMPCNARIAASIHAGEVDAISMRAAAEGADGFHALRDDALAKLAAGTTDLPEALNALAV
jgi:type II secretory ATPase GspE/PulE/Tfp pilus assembly ATPase PilB-like protein